ncbi:MAG: hypothetical protein ACLFV7_01090 [Phycisphaerae bacterium]
MKLSHLLHCIVIALLVSAVMAGAAEPRKITRTDKDGRTIAIPTAMDEDLKNPLPTELENGFQDRANRVLKKTMQLNIGRVNTYFENEKRTYGHLMMQAMGGDESAIGKLQARDVQGGSWHKHTLGIDWFACFTIKHQVRKYFYFGDRLEDDYRRTMYRSAKIWTEKDPHRRPHHAYKGGPGWGPDAKNSWVDVRGTDNLWWMRNCAVYLMAEETGNKATAEKYKQNIRRHVVALYRIGMGEWDSENYHGHSIAPVLSLYDFAKDREVKLLAKAALDWFMTAGAVKYYRGGFNGPTKRDYNHPYPMGGSAASGLWLYFGQYPGEEIELESDEVHAWTSNYRPPLAVMNLGRKKFDRPAEIFAAKPDYGSSKAGRTNIEPEELETQYIGETFQLGTLAKGTGRGDINGFKILTYNSEHGVDYIVPAPIGDPRRTGSPRYGSGSWEPNRVAQYRNLAIWLTGKPDAPWLWVLPKGIEVEQAGGVLFLKAERTWMAFHPINLEVKGVHQKLTEKVRYRMKGGKKRPIWPDHKVISAQARGGKYSGFAVEIGEKATHGDYAAFRKAVLEKAKLDLDGLKDGKVRYASATGTRVGMDFGVKLADFKVYRNGTLHDWKRHRAVYRDPSAPQGKGLIDLPWRGDGTLRVSAGGATFTCTVGEDGKVTFDNSNQR